MSDCLPACLPVCVCLCDCSDCLFACLCLSDYPHLSLFLDNKALVNDDDDGNNYRAAIKLQPHYGNYDATCYTTLLLRVTQWNGGVAAANEGL